MAAKAKPESGPPRWTYVLGAIVAAAGMLWGVVSFFIPKSEIARPDLHTPAPAPPVSVTVPGSGSVGVGIMSGGSIAVGATTPASSASDAASQAR